MNEFDYEVMQRKRVASSARHRVNGVKSKKCSLPSDHLTPKQWKERNGSVMSYNLNQPMRWAEFKEMPADIKKMYIENLIEKHGATGGSIAQMLGISPSAFSHHVVNAKLGIKFDPARRSKEKRIAWQHFLGESAEEKEVQPVDVVEVPIMESDAPVVVFESESSPVLQKCEPESSKPTGGMQMNHFSLSFSGSIDIEMVANSLRYIVGNGQNAQLKIDCVMGA